MYDAPKAIGVHESAWFTYRFDAERNARNKSRRSSAKTGGGETHDRAGSGMGCGDEWDATEMQEDPQ